MGTNLLLNPKIKWIGFHCGYDFGYLLKVMLGTALPDSETSFETKNSLMFPQNLDLKILVHPFDRFKGSLQKIADFFNIKRVGKLHNGGSDALTTSQV